MDGLTAARNGERWRIDESGAIEEEEAAAVMYCLSAVQRFERISKGAITAVVGEIALLGGLRVDGEAIRMLQSLPDEDISGLQLMCLMDVGFKDINPALDTGMDLAEPYETALKMLCLGS